MSCPNGLPLMELGVGDGGGGGVAGGGQGHTCVHHTGACVSPRSVVEVGHQSRPRKKFCLKSKGGDTQGTYLACFWQSCVLIAPREPPHSTPRKKKCLQHTLLFVAYRQGCINTRLPCAQVSVSSSYSGCNVATGNISCLNRRC